MNAVKHSAHFFPKLVQAAEDFCCLFLLHKSSYLFLDTLNQNQGHRNVSG